MERKQEMENYTFLKGRAAQLFAEGQVEKACALLRAVDEEQARRFEQSTLGNIRAAK